MWPEQTDNQKDTDLSFSDLTEAFAANDALLLAPDFTQRVTQTIQREERRRRAVLAGFGLFGGLIAGSQFAGTQGGRFMEWIKSFTAPIFGTPPISADLASGLDQASSFDWGSASPLIVIAALMLALCLCLLTLTESA